MTAIPVFDNVQKEFYLGMSQRMLVASDFLTTAGHRTVDGLTAVPAGAGAGAFDSVLAFLSDHPGVWYLTTGTAVTGRVFLIGGSNAGLHVGVGGVTRWGNVISTSTLISDAVNRFALRTGLMSIVLPNTILFGIGFEYQDDQNGGRWQAICSNGVETSVDTGVVVAISTYYKMEFEVNPLGTSVEFFIDDVSVATIATNIPQGTGFRLFSNIHIMKLLGVAGRAFFCDSYYLYQELTR